MLTREVCKLCLQENSVGFSVSDDIWFAVVPQECQNRVVCLGCFTKLADEKLVQWDLNIVFFPVSRVTFSQA